MYEMYGCIKLEIGIVRKTTIVIEIQSLCIRLKVTDRQGYHSVDVQWDNQEHLARQERPY